MSDPDVAPIGRLGNIVRNTVEYGKYHRLELHVDAATFEDLSAALWAHGRACMEAAARIDAGIRPYLWDKNL